MLIHVMMAMSVLTRLDRLNAFGHKEQNRCLSPQLPYDPRMLLTFSCFSFIFCLLKKSNLN